MKSCCPQESMPVWTFLIGTMLGFLAGMLVGSCPTRRSMKKVAKRTAHSVSDAIDHLRDTLQPYL